MTDSLALDPILDPRERARPAFNDDLPHDERFALFEAHVIGGGKVEATDWMPDDYRTAVLRFVEMHANSELMGVLPEREWLMRAPTLRRKLALTAKVQDEVGHAQLLYRVAEDLGKSRDAMIEDLLAGKTKFHNVSAWAAHQRIHQYDGGHNETHGGVRLNIDGDYVDAATAAAGAGAPLPSAVAAAPSLSVSPTADGGIELRPSWNGFAGISSWEVVGGPAPTTLSPVSLPISANARPPIRVRSAFAYFGVLALGATGQTLGSSAPVATPPHVAIFGNSAFVPSRGLGGLPVGCFNTVACHVSTTITTITAGRTSLAATGPEHIPAGGGLTYFKLSPSAHRLVLKARHRRLAVRITVRDVSGSSVTRPLNLIPFATSGASALRSLNQAPTLRIVGATDFVSHAGVGGILAACFSTFPCHPSTTITVAGRVVARTTPEFLGVNELGYLIFRLTGAGRTLLAHARGNQLGARVTVNDGGTIAGGQIVLASFT